MRILIRFLSSFGLALMLYPFLYAQTAQDSVQWYQLEIEKDLPLEESLKDGKTHFYAANRRLDSLKSVAMQVNILTADEMTNAGATNIPEALQLLPEFIVKSKSNGLYNVEYRGASTVLNPRGTEQLLLLIDAIPYNDALSGQVWWEALPIAIENLERIEVIRTPQGTWFGYGGALAVINLVSKSSTKIKGTSLSANLQAGTANTHQYQAAVGMRVNETLSGSISGFYQRRNRFEDNYYLKSLSRYVPGDSILFYQPEALQTNPKGSLALQSSGFNLHSTYRWNDSVFVSVNLANQNSEAQSIFSLYEEVSLTTRTSRTNNANLSFSAPHIEAQAFRHTGERNFATGYAGMEYSLGRTGARVGFRETIGNYYFTAGTEWLHIHYTRSSQSIVEFPLSDGLVSTPAQKESLVSIYLQQKASFFSKRLQLESGQRVYHTYQNLKYPIGYHFATRWFISNSLSAHAGAARVLQYSNQLLESSNPISPQFVQSYNLGLSKRINKKAGEVRLSAFRQQSSSTETEPNFTQDPMYTLPLWGSTLELNYKIGQISFIGNGSWFNSDNTEVKKLHPSLMASIRANYAGYFNKLNINFGLHYYGEHQNMLDAQAYDIPEQWMFNTRFSYRIWKSYNLSVNVRNILNNKNYNVPQADTDQRLILLGLNVVL